MAYKFDLTEEDVRNLPDDKRKEYEDFIETVRETGVVYKAKLEKFDEVLNGQYDSDVLYRGGQQNYLQVVAQNISNVLDLVVQYRNDVIHEKREFNKMGFENINKGLEDLKSFINTKLQSYTYNDTIGSGKLKDLLPRIDQIEDQISKDIEHFQGFKDEKHAAKVEYKFRKGEYDRLSTFGKLRARLSGQKQELDEAQRKNAHYNSQEARINNPELGEMFNPSQYDEYLEQQKKKEEEEKTGGMSL